MRLVRRDFPDDQVDTVLATLAQYGTESHDAGQHRVQVAILKLANGDLGELERAVSSAKADFRDVLAWAEYPESMRKGHLPSNSPDVEHRWVRDADWRQYKQWLER